MRFTNKEKLIFCIAVIILGVLVHIWSAISYPPPKEPIPTAVPTATAIPTAIPTATAVPTALPTAVPTAVPRKVIHVNRGERPQSTGYIEMKATTYDLSIASCGKSKSHPEYGITRSGKRAQVNRTVATDPKVIPLGTKLYIECPPPYEQLNGWYVAEDTGGAIKGNKIDIFIGEYAPKFCRDFGIRKVKVFIKN